MVNLVNPPNVNLSQIVVDAGLDLSGGDYDILLKAARTVDGKDVSALPKITTGSYTGDGTDDRAIPHGLGVVPDIVFIIDKTGIRFFRIIVGDTTIYRIDEATAAKVTVSAMDATNFYVNTTGAGGNGNASTFFSWCAFGA